MRILLVDSMGMLYRGHFAMIGNPLRAPGGMVTSGLHHLVNETLSLIERLRPDSAAAAFDSHEPGFRNAVYPEYKAGRPETPPDLVRQAEAAPRLFKALGIPVIAASGWEADDLIASCAWRAESAGWSVDILSSDKDLLQLVSDSVSVIRPGRPGSPPAVIGPDQVAGVIGVEASQIADFLALAGDSSDNVPGARGIGPKTAARLIGEFGSVDGIYGSLAKVRPESLRTKLAESEASVRMSLELVTLRADATEARGPDELRLGKPDAGAAGVLSEYGMRTVAVRMGVNLEAERRSPSSESTETGPESRMGDSSSLSARLTMGSSLFAALLPEGPGYGTRRPDSLVLAADDPDENWFYDLGRLPATPPEVASIIGSDLVVSYDSKTFSHLSCALGIPSGRPAGDLTLARYLLTAGDEDSGRAASKAAGALFRDFDISAGHGDALRAASENLRLLRGLEREIAEDEGMERVYRTVELPLSPVLSAMERRGVSLDSTSLEGVSRELTDLLGEIESRAEDAAGIRVNLRSPSQVSSVLFDHLGLPRIGRTGKGAASSDATVLQALAGLHPFVGLVAEHREISKLISTYVGKLPSFVSPVTGLIHTSFNQAVTATGRLSSSDPNLQNIPIRTERGREIRRCFGAPRAGDVLVSADYSQIELRVLAHLAGGGALRRAYREDADIHSRTALAVFGSSSPEHRRKAKEINFSIIYGVSAHGLAQRLGVDRGTASGIINRYFAAYPEVDAYFRSCVAETESRGETRTILGRRRLFRNLASARGNTRKSMERMAVNTTVQGSAADLMKLAMIGAADRLGREVPEAGLVLQVHDEIVASCPPGRAEDVAGILRESMEGAYRLEVPLRVETGWGENWLEAHG